MAIGKNRRPRRIQEVLENLDPPLTMKDVAGLLGKHYQTVWSTTHGVKNNREVLRYYLEIGVPPEDLDLPRDLRAERTNREVA